LDDYDNLRKLAEQIPDGSDFLRSVGDMFQSVGLCDEAVLCYCKAGDTKAAVDCCVTLNQWDQAVKLAEKHSFPQIETLLTKYASHLLEKNRVFQAVELYRKANRSTDAAKLLCNLALEAGRTKVNPLRAKKLYVLAAMEMDRFRKRMLDPGAAAVQSTAQTLATLLAHESATSDKNLENPWKGAEAYHYFLLAQRQLYAGKADAALRTALRLLEYEDVLETREVYSIVALASFYTHHFGQCSRAFIKLEALDDANKEDKEKYKKLAVSIFIRHPPRDPAQRGIRCPNAKCSGEVFDWYTSCPECNRTFNACVASGRAILNPNATGTDSVATCRACRHHMFEREMRAYQHCPMCHTPLPSAAS